MQTSKSSIPETDINWDELSFQLYPTKTMFLAKWTPETQWAKGQCVPFGDLTISPAAAVLNYAQGIFEGLKAQRTEMGEIVLFRPDQNAKRFVDGARRLCMPEYLIADFIDAVKKVVIANQAYVPPYEKGSLYIRPCLWGTGALLGVNPADEYTFCVFTSPVGPYFKYGLQLIKLIVDEDYNRAAPKGTGAVKYIGNYAKGLLPATQAKAQGYNACLYLDAKEDRYVDEAGVANFFCIKGNTLLTPELGGTILPGITRDSVIKLAEEVLGMQVQETKLLIEEALAADECFCVGTAAVVTPIGSISYKNKETIFNNNAIGKKTLEIYNLLTDIQLRRKEDSYNWVISVD